MGWDSKRQNGSKGGKIMFFCMFVCFGSLEKWLSSEDLEATELQEGLLGTRVITPSQDDSPPSPVTWLSLY